LAAHYASEKIKVATQVAGIVTTAVSTYFVLRKHYSGSPKLIWKNFVHKDVQRKEFWMFRMKY